MSNEVVLQIPDTVPQWALDEAAFKKDYVQWEADSMAMSERHDAEAEALRERYVALTEKQQQIRVAREQWHLVVEAGARDAAARLPEGPKDIEFLIPRGKPFIVDTSLNSPTTP